MFSMILRMSMVTMGMILLTVIMWLLTRNKKLTLPGKLATGIIFGLAAVASTHWGVNYNTMVLNVRDIAPLSAGLFFGPVPGILAGLIGGIERYIAGTYFGVGSYTRIACSISTCLAGFISAAFNRWMFRGEKPTPFYAFSLGAVTEVFHMLTVLVTHRSDMDFAMFVVDTCAVPMIIFTALGMVASSLVLWLLSPSRSKLHKPEKYEIPISARLQAWLVLLVVVMFIFTFAFSQTMQRRTIIQNTQATMRVSVEDAKKSLDAMDDHLEGANALAKQQGLESARAIAREMEHRGGIERAAELDLDELCELYGLYEIDIINSSGYVAYSSKQKNIGFNMANAAQSRAFLKLLEGDETELAQDFMATGSDSMLYLMYAGVAIKNGIVQVAYDRDTISKFMNIADIGDIIDSTHLGKSGNVYITGSTGRILSGKHGGEIIFSPGNTESGSFYNAEIFGVRSYCMYERHGDYSIFAVMPESELNNSIKASGYETAFADILLFALIFLAIYILVDRIIVRNLDRINNSLAIITRGNLNEVVDVNSSSEFASLSRDINQTVDTLKRYISEAENRINEELEFARSIQSSALPKVFKFQNITAFEAFASMDPAKEVGGDFYDLFFAGANKLALVVADVSGKGIPAALFMMRSKTAIKSLAESGRSPREILERANDELYKGNDANMFVTAWIGIIDLETGIMRCANAGHEYPAIMRANSSFELYKDKHGLALACMDGMPYTEYEIQLNPGDKLFVYTDGVPEATNEDDEQFGTERMLEALDHVRTLSVDKALPFVRERIAAFAGNAEQFDDITMLGFEFKHKIAKQS